MTDALQKGRDLLAAADADYLDRLAAHDCGASAAALIAIDALREALESLDRVEREIAELRGR